jgi:hypothetical protein
LGWKGSGFNYRKIEDNHVVKVFGLQGTWAGGSVCCETAIHFDFIPDMAGREPHKTSPASCIIRERLSPNGTGDYHWDFKASEEANVKSINQIWQAFATHGQAFYADFDHFPAPFDQIEVKDLSARDYKLMGKYHISNKIHFTWILKEINQFIGNNVRAKEFSDFGVHETLHHAQTMAQNNPGKLDAGFIEMNRERFEMR